MSQSSRYQWYQSDSFVFVSVMRKGVDPSTVCVNFQEQSVTVQVNKDLIDVITLSNKIDPNKSTFKCTPMKIELKLAKLSSANWSSLDSVEPTASPKQIGVGAAGEGEEPKKGTKAYHDWDAVAKEADEIEEGDPLNNLFQKIFKDANEDTRRAMIKSFTESNGTVLSTNWDEVGKGKVEMKPPDGMEFREYPK